MSVQPTPEHHHKRIARVIHSEPAAPCEQGASNLMGRVEVTNHFRYTCRDHASGFAAAAVFGANTPLFGAIDAAEVVTGFWGASAC